MQLEFTPAAGESLEVSLVLQGATADIRQTVEQGEAHWASQTERLTQKLDQFLKKNAAAKTEWERLTQEWSQRRKELKQQIQSQSRLAILA